MGKHRLTFGEIWRFRAVERRAFFWCLVTLACGYLAFFLSGGIDRRSDWLNLLPLGVFTLGLLLIHSTLLLGRFQGDPGLVIPVAFLSGLGLLAQFRMGLFDFESPFKPSHFAYPIGIVAMLSIAVLFKNERYLWLRHLRWLSGLGAIALVGALLATGSRFRGAVYASGNLTPTEIIKVFVVLFLAGQFASLANTGGKKKHRPSELGIVVPTALLLGVLFALLLWQRDLGMVAILGGLSLVVLFTATGRWSYVALSLVAGTVALGGAYQFFLHSQQRIKVWLDPFFDPTGASWQLLQGLSGMFSGGLWGAGFGGGNPERIPIAASDFIYAVIGEELGFAGCVLVVFLFLAFLHRAFRAAQSTPHPYGALLITGLATVIALQTFLNIGGVTKTLPLTGIPLPFISHGGSSLITMFICLGLIIAIADDVPPQLEKATKAGAKKRGRRS